MTQQHGYFFLNVDDYLSFAQPIGQPLIVLPELLILTGQRIGLRFRPSLLRGQPFHDAGRPLPPSPEPRDEQSHSMSSC